MKAMYLVIRYIGIPYSVANVLANMPLFSLTDAGCNIMNWAINGTNVVVTAMLGVIMIARLHAMYQRTRSVLIFLVIVFLAVNISCGVIAAMGLKQAAAEVLILSGTYTCNYGYEGNIQPLIITIWVLNTVWEVSALCLAVWIAVKHFRDLQRFGLSTGSTTGDCFRVLIKSHVFYFASFVGVSCLQLILVSPYFSNLNSVGAQTLFGVFQILLSVQMFVLGPRLILSVREYHAKLMAESDAETSMKSVVFQEHVNVPTSSIV
jgi:hypothetical protein